MKILSTKILTKEQRDIVSDVEVVEKSFIEITFPQDYLVDEKLYNVVFTSANSVRAVFEKNKNKPEDFERVHCVGLKTASLLASFGITVEIIAKNAVELAEALIKEIIQEIHFFCGNLRNSDLPNLMAENGVLVTEYMVYQTELIPHTYDEKFDYVLFYSPSGIKSYIKANNTTNVAVICIGSTTATAAVDHFEEVYMADEQNVESVLQKVKKLI